MNIDFKYTINIKWQDYFYIKFVKNKTFLLDLFYYIEIFVSRK